MGHVLIADSDRQAAQALAQRVARRGHSVSTAASIEETRRFLAMQPPGLLLLNHRLSDGPAAQLLSQSAALVAGVQVALLADATSLQRVIRQALPGVAHCLSTPVDPAHLDEMLALLPRTPEARDAAWRPGALVGESGPMREICRQIERVAATTATVFIQGESGTGKELVARAVHERSERRDRPFLAVNCGAISPQLIESEVFGHERGSFTGAERLHLGFFERADGGTLFLDEITEMPPDLQVKLLRVLESGTFMRVGSTELRRTDVRLIAATNRDAHAAVAEGALRQDLLYRLDVFPIRMPALRERPGDVPLLAGHFLDELQRGAAEPRHFTPAALQRLQAYDWPGNVRELRNVVQRAWIMSTGRELTEEWMPRQSATVETPPQAAELQAAAAGAEGVDVRIGMTLREIERRMILGTFEHCGHHKERAAAMLGISMKTLYNRLKDYARGTV